MSLIYARKARPTDTMKIMQIINQAKAFLRASGSSQWQGTYPDEATIASDLKNNVGWVLIVDKQVAGYAAVVDGIEPTYQEIEGKWKNDVDIYTTIHRMAISGEFRGMHLTNFFMSNIISLKLAEGIHNFRIDTSKKNKIVQHIATSHNFEYRGIIYVDEDPIDNSRLAYELNI